MLILRRLSYLPLKTCQQGGFTYVELMVAVVIAGLLMLGLLGVMNTALDASDAVRQRNELTQQARFAMGRMVRTVAHTRLLLLPQRDKSGTNWPENIREQTVPPSPPVGDSTLATAVLAVTLPAYIDLDSDQVPDADNDGDGLFDEDLPEDVHNDNAAGIYLIDDGGNGTVDEGRSEDDDEQDDIESEDPINGVDDDADGSIDEDPSANMNEDGCPGICGVDDDGDGSIDEGGVNNDDEEGGNNEDWYDPLVYYLNAGVLHERMPVPWDTDGDSDVDGRDFSVSPIADNVTRFRVERVPTAFGAPQLVDITLELTHPATGETISLQSRIRVGGAL